MNFTKNIKSLALRFTIPLPFNCRHIEYSTIASVDDQPGAPSEHLLNLSLEVITAAKEIDLSSVSVRMRHGPFFPDIWPGEHYKLLAGFIKTLQPRKVIEIGTGRGLSALSMLAFLPKCSEILTFDIIPWHKVESTVFDEADFNNSHLKQVIGDLSEKSFFDQFKNDMMHCDFLFIDGPKDVVFEKTFLAYLETISLPTNCVAVLDDIRQWKMLKIWREVQRPKLDLTSFGHWSGTGVIDWNG